MYLKDDQHILEMGEVPRKLCQVFPQLLDQLAVTDTTVLVNLLQILLGAWDVVPQPHIMCLICKCSLSLLTPCCFLQRAQNNGGHS